MTPSRARLDTWRPVLGVPGRDAPDRLVLLSVSRLPQEFAEVQGHPLAALLDRWAMQA